MDSMTAFGTLEMLDDESISLTPKIGRRGANIKALLIMWQRQKARTIKRGTSLLFVVLLLLTQFDFGFFYIKVF